MLDEIYRRSEPYWQTRKNELHVPIVYRYAQQLLAYYPDADAAVVLPAALMHDNGWFMVPQERLAQAFGPHATDAEANRLHELEGVHIARAILRDLDYDAQKSAEILLIIEGHDSRLEALSRNDQLVKDADKLWRFDPLGFEVDRERFGKEWQPYWNWLQERVEPWFFTPEAKAIARTQLAAIAAHYATQPIS